MLLQCVRCLVWALGRCGTLRAYSRHEGKPGEKGGTSESRGMTGSEGVMEEVMVSPVVQALPLQPLASIQLSF